MKPDLPKNPMTITPIETGRSLSIERAKAKYVPPFNGVQEEVKELLKDLHDMDNYDRRTDPHREKLKEFLLEIVKLQRPHDA